MNQRALGLAQKPFDGLLFEKTEFFRASGERLLDKLIKMLGKGRNLEPAASYKYISCINNIIYIVFVFLVLPILLLNHSF